MFQLLFFKALVLFYYQLLLVLLFLLFYLFLDFCEHFCPYDSQFYFSQVFLTSKIFNSRNIFTVFFIVIMFFLTFFIVLFIYIYIPFDLAADILLNACSLC